MNINQTKRSIFGLLYAFMFISLYACGKSSEDGATDDREPTVEGEFLAGAAVVDITGSVPSGFVLHDKLHARVLVLDDRETRLAFVVADLRVVPREVFDEAKRLIAKDGAIDPANIMMSATHTHSTTRRETRIGQLTPLGYSKTYSWNYGEPLDGHQMYIASQIAMGLRQAIANLEPAKIGFGSVDVPQWVFNRRWLMKEPVVNPYGGFDKVLFNPGTTNRDKVQPVGPVDPEVAFIAVQSVDGRPISVLANYSTHYVGGVPEGHISADYFPVFGEKLGALLKAQNQSKPFVGILSNGTSGDVNTINFAGGQPSFDAYKKIDKVADDLAKAVYQAYKNVSFQDKMHLSAIQSELSLDVRRADQSLLEHVNSVLSRPSNAPMRHPRERTQANYVMQLEKEWPDEIAILLQVFRIGDIAVSAIPFEVFAETGLELKSKSPFRHCFTVSFGNGWYGYLPTPEQHQLGGWETWMGGSNKVEENASNKIVERVLEMQHSLKN